MSDFGSERPLAAWSRMNDVGCAQPIRAPPSGLFTHERRYGVDIRRNKIKTGKDKAMM